MAIDCHECRGLGDDYYIDADGELVSACDGCPNNETLPDCGDGWALVKEEDGERNDRKKAFEV